MRMHGEGEILMDGFGALFWLILIIICIIVEIATLGLTSIWFAAGAVAAFIAALLRAPIPVQVILFFVVSVIALIFTRPIALKWFNRGTQKTNYQSIIGQKARITQRVDNLAETGSAVVNGQEWTARSADDNISMDIGETVNIIDIRGVKIIVERFKED